MSEVLHIPRYTSLQAAKAIGIPYPTLNTYLGRSDVVLAPNSVPELRNPGAGRSRLWSPIRILHVALTRAIFRSGVPMQPAAVLALGFTDHNGFDGAKSTSIVGDLLPPSRQPGDLYADGHTICRVFLPKDERAANVSIDRLADVFASPFHHGNRSFGVVVLIDLQALRSEVLTALLVRTE